MARKHIFTRLFVMLTLLVGLSVGVFLMGSVTIQRNSIAAEPVDIFFSPETAGIPPDTTFKFMIDPKGQTLSYIQTAIYFDRNILALSGDPIVGNSNLFSYRAVTPASEANLTGTVEIVLIQRPGTVIPTNTFEVFSLPVTFLSTAPPVTSYISVIDEQTQIVARNNATPLAFNINYATVNVNGGAPAAIAALSGGASAQSGSCPSSDYIDTAIGCIPINNTQLIAEFLLRWGLGIAGGIAFILIVYASFMIMTSAGDPKKLQAAKELLTAAFTGLVLLVFSAYILRVIGVDLLQIPGL